MYLLPIYINQILFVMKISLYCVASLEKDEYNNLGKGIMQREMCCLVLKIMLAGLER